MYIIHVEVAREHVVKLHQKVPADVILPPSLLPVVLSIIHPPFTLFLLIQSLSDSHQIPASMLQ